MKTSFTNIKISGVLGVVPKRTLFFDDEIVNYSHSVENSKKLKTVMGYDQHRVASPGVTASDLACHGLDYLFTKLKIDPRSIDAIFFISQTPDYVLPPTSAYIHGRFDFSKETYCVDINDGCCGFIKGLYEAGAFLSTTSSKRALIITGDVLSPKVSANDRNSFPLIGDAVALTILEKSNTPTPMCVEIFYDGKNFDKLIVPAGGARMPVNSDTEKLLADEEGNRRSLSNLVMQGRDVFAFTQTTVPDFILSFLDNLGLSPVDIDLFLLHQANSFILDRLRAKLGVGKEKVPDFVVRKYGNSSSATIPMTIASMARPLNGVKAMACGFGVGLSWGGALLDLDNLEFCNVIES